MRSGPFRSPQVFGTAPTPHGPAGPHGPPLATRGPLGLALVPVVLAAPAPVAVAAGAATLANTLPPTEEGWTSENKIPRRFEKRPLFAEKNSPSTAEIRQQGLGNCYLAGILGALANTEKGRARLRNMLKPASGPIVTTGREMIDGKPGKEYRIKSDRNFQVTFAGGKSVTVGDVLYANDSDHDWTPIFMDSTSGSLWPSLIELGYATMHGGYDKIGEGGGVTVAVCLDEVLGQVSYTMLHFGTGRKYQVKTDLGPLGAKDLHNYCSTAPTKPTFVATRADSDALIGHHAYVVLRLTGNSVSLYEPLVAKSYVFKLQELNGQLEALFSITL